MMGGTCKKQRLLTEVEELSAEGEHTHIPLIISLSSCEEQDKQVNSQAQGTRVSFPLPGYIRSKREVQQYENIFSIFPTHF